MALQIEKRFDSLTESSRFSLRVYIGMIKEINFPNGIFRAPERTESAPEVSSPTARPHLGCFAVLFPWLPSDELFDMEPKGFNLGVNAWINARSGQ